MLKKFYSIMLSVIMAAAFVTPASAFIFREDGLCYSPLTSYPGYDRAVVITSCDDTITHLVVPQTVNGYTVVGIGNGACYKMTSLTKVTLPSTIGSIDAGAFAQCVNLAEINLPESINFIGDEAFSGTVLTSVEFTSKGVVSIRPKAFADCKALKSVVLPQSLPTIKNNLFENCASLQSITIPESVTSIEDWAFNGCFAITSVVIPDAVTTIGKGAFCNCIALESVTYGKGVTDVNKDAFWLSKKIKSLYVRWTEQPNSLSNGTGGINTTTCTLYIPIGTRNLYKNVRPWNGFTNVKEYELGSGVTTVTADKSCNDNTVYTIDGRVVKVNACGTEGLGRGVYIFNGKKIVVR